MRARQTDENLTNESIDLLHVLSGSFTQHSRALRRAAACVEQMPLHRAFSCSTFQVQTKPICLSRSGSPVIHLRSDTTAVASLRSSTEYSARVQNFSNALMLGEYWLPTALMHLTRRSENYFDIFFRRYFVAVVASQERCDLDRVFYVTRFDRERFTARAGAGKNLFVRWVKLEKFFHRWFSNGNRIHVLLLRGYSARR